MRGSGPRDRGSNPRGAIGDIMRKKVKEKIWASIIAFIFFTSMIMFGINFIPQKPKKVTLKNSYNRTLTQEEYDLALRRGKEVITFYHPSGCCKDVERMLSSIGTYSSGSVIFCNVISDNRTMEFDSYNGQDYLYGNDTENKTKIMELLCSDLVIKSSIPDCLQ